MTQKLIRPGGTIGIVGNDTMAQSLSGVAREMGYRVKVIGGDEVERPSVDARLQRAVGTRARMAAAAAARECDVVTIACEDTPRGLLDEAARHVPVRPGPLQISISQDRSAEREWLESAGFDIAPWRAAESRDQMVAAVSELGGSCYVKPRVRQRAESRPILVTSPREVVSAWYALRGVPTVIERLVPIDIELTILVARGLDGSVNAFPPALSVREHGELACSVVPGPMSPQLARKALELASYMARKLRIEGLLAVEMFLLRDGRLITNEIVPAPHPAFIGTEVSCATGQFEQLVRAITGLPLGATSLVRPTATVPLRMEQGATSETLDVRRALEVSGTRTLLHGPGQPANARGLVGHLYAVGNSPGDAVRRAADAWSRLTKSGGRQTVDRRTWLAERLLADSESL